MNEKEMEYICYSPFMFIHNKMKGENIIKFLFNGFFKIVAKKRRVIHIKENIDSVNNVNNIKINFNNVDINI
jgi:Zn-finger protein